MAGDGRPGLQHDWEYGNYIEGGVLEGRIDWNGLEEAEQHAKSLIEDWHENTTGICIGWSGGIDSLVLLGLVHEMGLQDEVPLVMTRTTESYPCHPEYTEGMADRLGFELDVLVNEEQDLDWVKANESSRLFPDYSAQFASNQKTQREPIDRWLGEHEDLEIWMNGHRNEHNVTPEYLRKKESYTEHAYIGSPIRTWHVNYVIAYADKYDLPISPVYHSSKPTSGGIPWWRRLGTNETEAESWWHVREIPVQYGYTDHWKHILDYWPEAEEKATQYAIEHNKALPDIEDGYRMGCDTHENPYPVGLGT